MSDPGRLRDDPAAPPDARALLHAARRPRAPTAAQSARLAQAVERIAASAPAKRGVVSVSASGARRASPRGRVGVYLALAAAAVLVLWISIPRRDTHRGAVTAPTEVVPERAVAVHPSAPDAAPAAASGAESQRTDAGEPARTVPAPLAVATPAPPSPVRRPLTRTSSHRSSSVRRAQPGHRALPDRIPAE